MTISESSSVGVCALTLTVAERPAAALVGRKHSPPADPVAILAALAGRPAEDDRFEHRRLAGLRLCAVRSAWATRSASERVVITVQGASWTNLPPALDQVNGLKPIRP